MVIFGDEDWELGMGIGLSFEEIGGITGALEEMGEDFRESFA